MNLLRFAQATAEYLCPRLFIEQKQDGARATSLSTKAAPPQTFEEAAAAAKELERPSVALRLKLYGLYKQATVGDAPLTEPSGSLLDPAASYKYKSWASLRGLQPLVAQERYIRAVAVASGFNGDGDGGDDGDGADSDDAQDALLDGESLEELDGALEGFAGAVMSAHAVSDEDVLAQARMDMESPLHGFARQGDLKSVRYLLGKPDAEPDARDEDEHTALHWACDGGHTQIAQDLIHSGADVNAQNCDGLTPLHMACACEHVAVAKLLITSGASTEIKDEDGSTARELCPSADFAEEIGL